MCLNLLFGVYLRFFGGIFTLSAKLKIILKQILKEDPKIEVLMENTYLRVG